MDADEDGDGELPFWVPPGEEAQLRRRGRGRGKGSIGGEEDGQEEGLDRPGGGDGEDLEMEDAGKVQCEGEGCKAQTCL